MPHAVSVNEKSLDLIATNNGGLKPEIEESPYSNGTAGSYFLLPDDPNAHAEILGVDAFFDTYEFIGPEHPAEFRPIVRLQA